MIIIGLPMDNMIILEVIIMFCDFNRRDPLMIIDEYDKSMIHIMISVRNGNYI